jgi:hypothetical protein
MEFVRPETYKVKANHENLNPEFPFEFAYRKNIGFDATMEEHCSATKYDGMIYFEYSMTTEFKVYSTLKNLTKCSNLPGSYRAYRLDISAFVEKSPTDYTTYISKYKMADEERFAADDDSYYEHPTYRYKSNFRTLWFMFILRNGYRLDD